MKKNPRGQPAFLNLILGKPKKSISSGWQTPKKAK